MILFRTIKFSDLSSSRGVMAGFDISHVPVPSFGECAYALIITFTMWTDQLVDGKMRVLRSDSMQFQQEIDAAGRGWQKREIVIDKWRSCIRERQKVRLVRGPSSSPQFS